MDVPPTLGSTGRWYSGSLHNAFVLVFVLTWRFFFSLCSVHDVVFKHLSKSSTSFKHIFEQRMGKDGQNFGQEPGVTYQSQPFQSALLVTIACSCVLELGVATKF